MTVDGLGNIGDIKKQKSVNISGAKPVEKSAESGIIIGKETETVVNNVHKVGIIDLNKYKSVTNKEIITDEVIITDNRINHIIERRGQEFYDEYSRYFADIVSNPDYIFKDSKADTAIASKTFLHNGSSVNLVIRLAVEGDNSNYKNSIITAIKENNKRFAQRLRNNKPVYELDKNE